MLQPEYSFKKIVFILLDMKMMCFEFGIMSDDQALNNPDHDSMVRIRAILNLRTFFLRQVSNSVGCLSIADNLMEREIY